MIPLQAVLLTSELFAGELNTADVRSGDATDMANCAAWVAAVPLLMHERLGQALVANVELVEALGEAAARILSSGGVRSPAAVWRGSIYRMTYLLTLVFGVFLADSQPRKGTLHSVGSHRKPSTEDASDSAGTPGHERTVFSLDSAVEAVGRVSASCETPMELVMANIPVCFHPPKSGFGCRQHALVKLDRPAVHLGRSRNDVDP